MGRAIGCTAQGRMSEIALHESWKAPLLPEFNSDYMAALKSFLVAEKAAGKI